MVSANEKLALGRMGLFRGSTGELRYIFLVYGSLWMEEIDINQLYEKSVS